MRCLSWEVVLILLGFAGEKGAKLHVYPRAKLNASPQRILPTSDRRCHKVKTPSIHQPIKSTRLLTLWSYPTCFQPSRRHPRRLICAAGQRLHHTFGLVYPLLPSERRRPSAMTDTELLGSCRIKASRSSITLSEGKLLRVGFYDGCMTICGISPTHIFNRSGIQWGQIHIRSGPGVPIWISYYTKQAHIPVYI